MVTNSADENTKTNTVAKISLSERPFYPKPRREKPRQLLKEDVESPHLSPTKKKDKKEDKDEKDPDHQLKFRTELCKFYEINGLCKFGDGCMFAHGKENLRVKVLKKSGYKKRPCINFFEHGICMYGNRCQFSHETKPVNDEEQSHFSYKAFLSELKLGNISDEKLKEIKDRPRLDAFKSVVRAKRVKSNSTRRKNHSKKKGLASEEESDMKSQGYIDEIAKIQREKKNE